MFAINVEKFGGRCNVGGWGDVRGLITLWRFDMLGA
jgi:hypothetical protein